MPQLSFVVLTLIVKRRVGGCPGSPRFNVPEAEEGQKVTVQEETTGMGCSCLQSRAWQMLTLKRLERGWEQRSKAEAII